MSVEEYLSTLASYDARVIVGVLAIIAIFTLASLKEYKRCKCAFRGCRHV